VSDILAEYTTDVMLVSVVNTFDKYEVVITIATSTSITFQAFSLSQHASSAVIAPL
jgi:hypothetical protein